MCKELEVDRGFCVWTTGTQEQFVDNGSLLYDQTWWELRPSMVMVPAKSWEKIKAYIIKNCARTGKCQDSKVLNLMEAK